MGAGGLEGGNEDQQAKKNMQRRYSIVDVQD